MKMSKYKPKIERMIPIECRGSIYNPNTVVCEVCQKCISEARDVLDTFTRLPINLFAEHEIKRYRVAERILLQDLSTMGLVDFIQLGGV